MFLQGKKKDRKFLDQLNKYQLLRTLPMELVVTSYNNIQVASTKFPELIYITQT
jgi:hypothetical protein